MTAQAGLIQGESDTPAAGSVRLLEGRERPLLQGHSWVLSGGVAEVSGSPRAGDAVEVCDAGGRVLGIGDFDPDSQLRVRVTQLGAPAQRVDDATWFEGRLRAALAWRTGHPLLARTDALRLVHAESDGLPGLTLDRYAHWLVLRPGTPAMLRRSLQYAELIERVTGCRGGWLRGDVQRPLAARELFGEVPEEPVEIREGGRRYWVDLRRGQKTGFYLDQRDARARFAELAAGQRVLDLFAYSGGFSAAALAGGAVSALAVESSAAACALARKNAPAAQVLEADVGEYLRGADERFGLVAVDPPPLAKRSRDVAGASRAYRELNAQALRRVAPGGHLFTFSCSHHVDAERFQKIIASAVREARRPAQILARLGAPADHPVSAAHPQGEYLSGLLLRVGD
jgi:23S rRNA (cytosine1962-C5)-methyltransferase